MRHNEVDIIIMFTCPHLCTAHCWAPLNAMFCLVIIVLAGDKTQEKNWGNKNVTSQNTFKYSYHVLLPISIDSLITLFKVFFGPDRISFRDTLAARGVGQPNYIISVSNL